MSRTLNTVALAAAAAMLVGCSSDQTSKVAKAPSTRCDACTVPVGQGTPISMSAAEALRETLQDERRVRAFYEGVIRVHGEVAPFVNVVQAEARHAAVIERLMTRHGVAVPAGPVADVPEVPGSLVESNRIAARLERENIEMYDRLLAGMTEPDIRTAFENLRAASKQNHLPAFERWAVNSVTPNGGRMMGYGFGGAGRGACLTTR